jgi:hypothetical protein
MLRSIVLASVLGPSFLASAACARAPAPPAVAAPRPPEPAGVAVVYRLLRSGDGDGVLLSGRTLVDPHFGARIDTLGAHSSAAEKLELDARARDDGSVLVQVKYEETSPEGARIDWRPAIRLAHGATARAEVNGSGWGRVLEVAVE